MSDNEKPDYFGVNVPKDSEVDAEIMEKIFTELRFRLKTLAGTKFANVDALAGPSVLLLASMALSSAAESVIGIKDDSTLPQRIRQAAGYVEAAGLLDKLLMEMVVPLHVAGCPYVDWLHLQEEQV